MAQSKAEKFEFQSEVKQLLDILVYSLYKNKEVFVRELVSNAVDALNKVQFETLSSSEIEDIHSELRIDISFNEAQKKLIVEDTGVGIEEEDGIPAHQCVFDQTGDLGAFQLDSVAVQIEVLAVVSDSHSSFRAILVAAVFRANFVVAISVEDRGDKNDQIVEIGEGIRKQDISNEHKRSLLTFNLSSMDVGLDVYRSLLSVSNFTRG